jgi:hypothetical protein
VLFGSVMRRTSRARLAVEAAAGAVALLPTPEAFACPDCATARVVRASVFDGRFGTNLLMISLPLLVLGAISILLYRIGLERRSPASTAAKEEAST